MTPALPIPVCLPCRQEHHPRCCSRGCGCGCAISARWMHAAANNHHPILSRHP